MKSFLLSAFLLLVNSVTSKLPSAIKVCSRNEPKLAECIIKSVQQLQPKLGSGVLGPGLTVPGIEPFKLANINIGRDSDFQLKLDNLVVKGPGNFRIDKLRANLKDLKFDFIVSFPKLDMRGKYQLSFNFLGTSLKAQGDMVSIFDDVKSKISMRGTKYEKNGQSYLRFEKFKITISRTHKRQIKLSDLFKQSPTLEEVGNAFINQNSEFFLERIYPSVEANLEDIFTTIANKITNDATYDELFPDE